ncbi:hypothetical protein BDR03DRAFT_410548 [Suillus americanus]|nr:hypothetical protein BDR03DRAFT_410548 [Suillus americanus]
MACPIEAWKGMFHMYHFVNLKSWRGCGLCCSIRNRLQETYTRTEEAGTLIKEHLRCPCLGHDLIRLRGFKCSRRAYCLMGAMSNGPAKLAVFTGFCAYWP